MKVKETEKAFARPEQERLMLEREEKENVLPHELVFEAERREGEPVKQEKIVQISRAFWRAVDKLKLNEAITDPKRKIV